MCECVGACTRVSAIANKVFCRKPNLGPHNSLPGQKTQWPSCKGDNAFSRRTSGFTVAFLQSRQPPGLLASSTQSSNTKSRRYDYNLLSHGFFSHSGGHNILKGLLLQDTRMEQILLPILETVESIKGDIGILRSEMKTFRKEMRSKHDKMVDKTGKKVDLISRQVGSNHEKLCRGSLYRNIHLLIGSCNELECFGSLQEQTSFCFTSIFQIAEHLKLKPSEMVRLRIKLVDISRRESIGRMVLSRFIIMLNHQLTKDLPAKSETWPKHVKDLCEMVVKIQALLPFPNKVSDVMSTFDELQNLANQFQLVKDLSEHVKTLFYFSMGPRFNVVQTQLLKEPWGMLLLFWVVKGVVRHPVLEVDVLGKVERKALKDWCIGLGEVKSSTGIAVEKGKRQLNFQEEVFTWVCKTICEDATVAATKTLFLVDVGQEEPKSLIRQSDGYIFVNTTQLPG